MTLGKDVKQLTGAHWNSTPFLQPQALNFNHYCAPSPRFQEKSTWNGKNVFSRLWRENPFSIDRPPRFWRKRRKWRVCILHMKTRGLVLRTQMTTMAGGKTRFTESGVFITQRVRWTGPKPYSACFRVSGGPVLGGARIWVIVAHVCGTLSRYTCRSRFPQNPGVLQV